MGAVSPALIDQFADPYWRLNNLYRIKDKEGKEVLFKMNGAQEDFYWDQHGFDIILKARQLGFTTLIQLMILDQCLFIPNTNAGIIAQTREDSESFFEDKIKFAYDKLDPEIKALSPAKQNSAKTLSFQNGSKIRVGTSLRSGTFQLLHVSEYGKICAKDPAKAREIRTGALNTVQAGQRIWVESTAEGHEGSFFEMCQTAKALRDAGSALSALDFKFHFHPWWTTQEYTLDGDTLITSEHTAYFNKLSLNHDISLSPEQKRWYVAKLKTQADDMRREFPSTPEEAFEASIEGAYYEKQITNARKSGRIGAVPFEPSVPVNTFWDLGMNDETAIWFHQRVGAQNRLIGYYSNSGETFAHYVAELNRRAAEGDWVWGQDYLPHDAKARVLDGSERPETREEKLNKLGRRNTVVVPRIENQMQGIDGVRDFLPSCWIDEQSCSEGLKAVENYRKEWDADKGVYKDRPRHDWASHGAKALETGAIGFKDTSAPKGAAGPLKLARRGVA